MDRARAWPPIAPPCPNAGRRRRTSALAELLATAGAVQADLLAFDLARVAGHEAGTAEIGLQGHVVVDQRPGDAVTDSAGLAGPASAVHVHHDVERSVVRGPHQRLPHD